MKAKSVVYWITTALIGFAFTSSGVAHLLRLPNVVEGITSLGYPAHFVLVLGFWKLLGGIAVSIPRFALIKEWAYAGMIFDLTGAAFAHVAQASGVRHVVSPLILACLVFASWALRPDSRKLPRPAT